MPDKPESANQVVDDSDDKVFGVSDIESDTDSMPGLETVYDSKEGVDSVDDKAAEDWLSDVGDDWETPCDVGYMTNELSRVDSKGSLYVKVDLESVGEQFEDPGMYQDSPFVSAPALEEVAAAISGGPSDAH